MSFPLWHYAIYLPALKMLGFRMNFDDYVTHDFSEQAEALVKSANLYMKTQALIQFDRGITRA